MASSSVDGGGGVGHPLDTAVRAALLGPHAHLAEARGRVLRYQPAVSMFLALPPDPDEQDWADAAGLVGPEGSVPTAGDSPTPPAGWVEVFRLDGVQLVDDGMVTAADPEAVVLGAADVPEMMALVEHAQPGPFRPRTIEMGTYLGIRVGGRLVAMAGERVRMPGWTEISAVCTHADFRGRGLATRLVRAIGQDPGAGRHAVSARVGGERGGDPTVRGVGVPAAAAGGVRGGSAAGGGVTGAGTRSAILPRGPG